LFSDYFILFALLFCALLPLFVAFVCLSNQNSCRFPIIKALPPSGKTEFGFVFPVLLRLDKISHVG